MDAFEYWKYSRIEIIERESTPLVDFADEEFNRAVLVGNFRHKNFMRDIELDIVNYKKDRGIIKSDDSFDKIYIDHVSNELCLRYFGKENMSTLIFGVELRKWIDSIHFFQYEAIHFLEKKKKISFLRFKTYVLSERSLSGKKS
ncbi:hypothetical protein K5E_08130 [Enterococcus thailandicus]|nr:hypothetical protein K4E_03800 [Enterococcus thailandicus]GMC08674.1 hypothetical protein K5E_08130 [Enterococcus thailandicus]